MSNKETEKKFSLFHDEKSGNRNEQADFSQTYI